MGDHPDGRQGQQEAGQRHRRWRAVDPHAHDQRDAGRGDGRQRGGHAHLALRQTVIEQEEAQASAHPGQRTAHQVRWRRQWLATNQDQPRDQQRAEHLRHQDDPDGGHSPAGHSPGEVARPPGDGRAQAGEDGE
ncbi:MAG: hypothetical protein R6X18_13535 [Chloroflexota bacterium]